MTIARATALATRLDGSLDGRAPGADEITKLVGIRFVEMAVGIESQVAELTLDGRKIVRSCGIDRETQVEGHGQGQVGRRLEAEEAARDLVAQLVVFRPADSVDEQVAEQVAGRTSWWSGPGCAGGPTAPPGRGVVRPRNTLRHRGTAGGSQEDLVLTGDPQIDGGSPSRRMSARRRGGVGSPDPERGLQPLACPVEGRDGMMPTADVVGCAILGQAGIMDLLVTRELGQQVRGEPEEAVGLAEQAEGELQVGDAPGRLDLAPGQGESQARPRRLRRDGGSLGARSRRAAGRRIAAVQGLVHPFGERRE